MKQISKWLIFAFVAIAQFMVVLDVSITNVALPSIQHELGFTISSLQWVITAYVLSFGGFLLLGGRAADLFGRRRMLLIGIVAFTICSLLIGLTESSVMLVTLRALQGVAAAFMSPAALSTVLVTFRDGSERNKALGFWTLVATGGASIGLLLGGILTQYLGWRWDFFVNVPVGIIMIFLIARFVPAYENKEKQGTVDVPGALLVTSGLMSLVFALSQAQSWGWLSLQTLVVLASSIALLIGFVVRESKARHPIMPLSIFSIRNVSGANLIMMPLYATMIGTIFLLTVYVQGILHYAPVVTGLCFLPFPVLIGVMSAKIPKLVARLGFRRFLVAGPLVIALSLLWLSRLPVEGSYFIDILPTLILMPLGIGMTIMPVVAAATSGVPPEESGLASGLVSTSQQLGGALGLAILLSVAAAVTAGLAQGPMATVSGFHAAFLVDIAFMLIAAGVAVFVIRDKKRLLYDQ